jgi:carbamoyltransferase
VKNILGISAFYHDAAACIVQDGKIVAAAQEERFTRKKHDETFPSHAIEYCLNEAGIGATGLDYVVFYEKPLLKFDRLLETYLAFAPRGFMSFRKAIPIWLKKKLFIERELRKGPLTDYAGLIVYPEHHESHAASAFYPSPYESAAIITIDGVGEWATTTVGHGKANNLEMLRQINFPHSLGLLYSAFTYYTGFRVNSGEYKLMGLAPYGSPKFVDLIKKELISIKADGSFALNLDYFDYCVGLKMTNRKFAKLFKSNPRTTESRIEQIHMDLAASIQSVIEEVILKIANQAYKITGEDNLCLAGGVALNCVSNGRIAREGPFKNIWIQPASGDAGGSLGAALFTWYKLLENPRVPNDMDSQNGSLLGPSFSDDQILACLQKRNASYEKFEDEGVQAERIAQLLASENVVGLHAGKMEFGPRALGNRSILGDPRSPRMQQLMNLKIKFRESFRPFAPSILAEHSKAYFDIGVARDSPYMLLVGPVDESKRLPCKTELDQSEGFEKLNIPRSDIPAVTHVDFSSRVQTVDKIRNPFYYRIIEAFYKKTGCPLVINTSFNIRSEPIVCTPEDAYNCFLGTEMDVLSVGSYLLVKKEQPPETLAMAKPYMDEFILD